MYLDVYVQVQSESYEFRKVKTTYILDWKEYIFTVVTLLCRLMLFLLILMCQAACGLFPPF